MTRKDVHIALRYALLGSVVFAVSCTTSSISTPSFAPTAALQNIDAKTVDNDVVTALPESTTVVPTGAVDGAQKPVEALALNPDTKPTDLAASATTQPKAEILTANTLSTTAESIPAAPTEIAATLKDTAENVIATVNSDPAATPESAKPKKGIFGRPKSEPTGIFAFFKKKQEEQAKDTAETSVQTADASAKPTPEAKKSTRIASKAPKAKKTTIVRALPGVKVANIFGISQATEAAKKVGEEVTKPVQLASANIGSAARAVANGIRKQHDGVSVKCFRPELVKIIKKIERHYGKPVVVTSGYRSPKRNRRAGGSSKSLHMYCAAADVQVKGISKWALAKYVRSMPGRGGVGTYCHTKSVHVDIGSKRDWNWRCRRK